MIESAAALAAFAIALACFILGYALRRFTDAALDEWRAYAYGRENRPDGRSRRRGPAR